MKRIIPLLFVVAVMFALAVPSALAQKMYGAEKYDKAKEVTLKGVVDHVERHTGPGAEPTTHFMLKTTTEMIEVQVAPADYVMKQNIMFAAGDEVEVIGSRVPFKSKIGSPTTQEMVILAREIKKGDRKFVLRDEQGKPVWAGKEVARK